MTFSLQTAAFQTPSSSTLWPELIPRITNPTDLKMSLMLLIWDSAALTPNTSCIRVILYFSELERVRLASAEKAALKSPGILFVLRSELEDRSSGTAPLRGRARAHVGLKIAHVGTNLWRDFLHCAFLLLWRCGALISALAVFFRGSRTGTVFIIKKYCSSAEVQKKMGDTPTSPFTEGSEQWMFAL